MDTVERYKIVIQKTDENLALMLRAGYVDFENDGMFNTETETMITCSCHDCPFSASGKCEHKRYLTDGNWYFNKTTKECVQL